MDKYISHWLERSNYDLETAKAMLDARRHLYVAYMCQQAVEKFLKAVIAQHGKENFPIHNLNRLAESAGLSVELTEGQIDLLAEQTAYNIEARYGNYKESLSEIVDGQKAKLLYEKTLELVQWLYKKDQVDQIIRGFNSRLEQEIPVQEVILFGSYAHGKPQEHSDIDLAVISEWFEGKPTIENLKFLARVAARYSTLIEALPFTEKEYRKIDERCLLSRIVRTGKKYKTVH